MHIYMHISVYIYIYICIYGLKSSLRGCVARLRLFGKVCASWRKGWQARCWYTCILSKMNNRCLHGVAGLASSQHDSGPTMETIYESPCMGTYSIKHTQIQHVGRHTALDSGPLWGARLSAAERRQNETRKYVTNSWVTCFGFQVWVRMAACFLAPRISSLVSHLRGLYLVWTGLESSQLIAITETTNEPLGWQAHSGPLPHTCPKPNFT
jgi:hypothetical protein